MRPQIRPAQRIWLQDDGQPVFGSGIRELLGRVESTGSLRAAAAEMGMAYSKAWAIVRRAEGHLGITLLVRRAGGAGGGGSALTDEGRWLVGAFGALLEDARRSLDQLYTLYFADHLGEVSAAVRQTGHPSDPPAPRQRRPRQQHPKQQGGTSK